MNNNSVMIICGRESVFIKVMVQKLADIGIEAFVCSVNTNVINGQWDRAGLITCYLDAGDQYDSGFIRFISDKLAATDKKMILIGEKENSTHLLMEIPERVMFKYFLKPLDNQAYADCVSSYFKNMSAGAVKKSILIVDDDPTYMGLVRDWLKDSYKVTMATSGIQAIKWLASNHADLILLDHEMPVVSGPQVLEMLRSDKETAGIPVVFLTGKSDMESVMEVVALKPAGYILKSVQKAELIERLNRFFLLNRFE
ncbi:MAG: response regulator [Clostridia bacterium]|nr:response regulator [Clostridia bacterium]